MGFFFFSFLWGFSQQWLPRFMDTQVGPMLTPHSMEEVTLPGPWVSLAVVRKGLYLVGSAETTVPNSYFYYTISQLWE